MNDTIAAPPDETSYPLSEMDPRDEAAMALLCHDMQAALFDVVGGLRLITAQTLDAATRLQFERVRASGEVLARLLEHGLAVLLGEADTAPMEDIDLASRLIDLEMRWSGRAAAKGLRFILIAAPDLPAHLRIDRLSVERVLSNLIGNAISYADAGTVTCAIDRVGADRFSITVTDQGPGFPALALASPRPLRRRPADMARPAGGMGLHIAEMMTERLGGQLTLRNLPAGGAEAKLVLPCLPGEGAVTIRPDLSGKRVLIADDNPTSRLILCRAIADFGASVLLAVDGVEALGLLDVQAFDLLIIDIEMPHLTGIDVIRALRARPGPVARMPVIAVSAHGRRSDLAAISAVGANAILSKTNLTPATLGTAVARVMLAHTRPLPPAELPPPQADDPPLLDGSRFESLLVMAGPEMAAELTYRLLIDLQSVKTGLQVAASGPDWVAIRAQTHVLISLAGVVGGLRLQARAEALNRAAHAAPAGAPAETPAAGLAEVIDLLDLLVAHVTLVRDTRQAPA